MKKFSCISEISLSETASWSDSLFLTLDIDWAADFVIERVLDVLEPRNIKATWFVTHDTPLLARMRVNKNFELGIHPNFNNLLIGDSSNGANAREVISRLLDIVPEARSVRSHSMCQSSVLSNLFSEFGLTHDCNHFIPFRSGLICRPLEHWNGMLKIPYFWEDDIEAMQSDSFDIAPLIEISGLKVFDFHPIHVFLNTETLDRYERTRPVHRDKILLNQAVNRSIFGVLDALNVLTS